MDEVTNAGAILRRLRTEAGLSMAQLAERAGVIKPSLQKWEAGVVPNVESAIRIARALGTTPEAIWGASLPAADVPADEAPTAPEAA